MTNHKSHQPHMQTRMVPVLLTDPEPFRDDTPASQHPDDMPDWWDGKPGLAFDDVMLQLVSEEWAHMLPCLYVREFIGEVVP